MNEQRRLAYLEVLGVDSYLPRRRLPGAAPGRRAAWPSPAASAPAAPGAEEASGQPPPAAQPAAPAPPRRETAPTPRPVPARTAAGEEGPCRFSLVTVLAGDWLWLEDLAGEPLASAQVRLIRAMAHAVGFQRGRAARPGADVATFDWPMHNNRQFDNGEAAARSSVGAFLQRRVQESGCRGIVLLGEDCRRWVAAEELPVAVIGTHATAVMLQRPELKQSAWRDLAPLRAAAP